MQHPAEAHAAEPLAPPVRGAVWADCGPFKRLSFSGGSGWKEKGKGKEAMGYNLALLPSEALCFLIAHVMEPTPCTPLPSGEPFLPHSHGVLYLLTHKPDSFLPQEAFRVFYHSDKKQQMQ